MKNNFIILDVETTGLDETKAPITQIAFQALDTELKPLKKFETFVKPYAGLTLDTKIMLTKTTVKLSDIQKHGIDGKLLVKNLMIAFKDLKTKAKGDSSLPMLVGHNIKFDIKFLKFLFKTYNENLFDYISLDYFDTQRLSALYWKNIKSDEISGMKLKDCCARAGIQLIDAHGAMADVQATTKLFKFFVDKFSSESKTETKTEQEVTNIRNFYQF